MKKHKCSVPKLHEKQEALLCGKHAINNLLQQALSDCSALKSIGKTIAREYDISPNELVNVKHGFYCYYVIDSLEDYPIKIDVVKKWLEQTDNVLAIKVLKKVFKH